DDLTGGFQAMVGRQLFGSAHSAVELSFFGLYDWNERASFSGGGLGVPGLGLETTLYNPNFVLPSDVDLRYDSSLYNVEFNYVRSFYARRAKIDFLSGFRYV